MLFLIAYLMPIVNIGFLTGYFPESLIWTPIFYGFVLIPLLDLVGKYFPMDPKPLQNAKLAPLLLVGMVPVLALNLFFMFKAVSEHGWNWFHVVNTGLAMGAFGINTAHELIHRKKKWERAMGVALLVGCNYGHFRIEHVYGHHRNVSTPEDPATARLGESVYSFWVRSVFMGLWSAWKIDRARGSYQMIQLLVIQAVLAAGVYFYFGAIALLAHGLQSVIAIALLETINYVEHYGLERKRISDTRYEPVNDTHSWDTEGPGTNLSLWNLGKHANHHSVAHLPYNELKLSKTAFRLPYGYPAMVLISLVPPLFKVMMNRYLAELRATQTA